MNENDREISKGIVVNPNRMSGAPTIRGTRVTARMVANLQAGDDPMHPDDILDDYPQLTYADLVNAKLWASRTSIRINGSGAEAALRVRP